jgi:hypothetical protein
MPTIISTRGQFVICESCYAHLKESDLVDHRGWSKADTVFDEFCMNCYDVNKILIDDLLGSTE